jgi:hypothetical protein
MASQDQYRVTAFVDGFGSLGVFDKMSGGGGDSESVKYAEGGMGAETAQGGRQTTENVTITRKYERNRDHAQAKQLAQSSAHVIPVAFSAPQVAPEDTSYCRTSFFSVDNVTDLSISQVFEYGTQFAAALAIRRIVGWASRLEIPLGPSDCATAPGDTADLG